MAGPPQGRSIVDQIEITVESEPAYPPAYPPAAEAEEAGIEEEQIEVEDVEEAGEAPEEGGDADQLEVFEEGSGETEGAAVEDGFEMEGEPED